MSAAHTPLTIADCVRTACMLDVMAAKPGNVHRGADFEDSDLRRFPLGRAGDRTDSGACVRATFGRDDFRLRTSNATHGRHERQSGDYLVVEPFGRGSAQATLARGCARRVGGFERRRWRDVYAAIVAAKPGGLGDVAEHDVRSTPPEDLLTAMRAAAERDSIALQYSNGFAEIETVVLPSLLENLASLPTLSAIVRTFLQALAKIPDTLIARKCETRIADDASEWAGEVLAAGEDSTEAYYHALADLDFWLRSDGHKRNPGTTADLLCAAIFIALSRRATHAAVSLGVAPAIRAAF
ncbi:MAG: triphosphoribosyl-dephospho-CoA synthase [Pirellulales bacterium]